MGRQCFFHIPNSPQKNGSSVGNKNRTIFWQCMWWLCIPPHNDLHTLCHLWLRSRSISQKVSALRCNCDLVLFECLCVRPHESRAVHMLQEGDLVLVSKILPVDVVFLILAELTGIVTFWRGSKNPCKFKCRPSKFFCRGELWQREFHSWCERSPSWGSYRRTPYWFFLTLIVAARLAAFVSFVWSGLHWISARAYGQCFSYSIEYTNTNPTCSQVGLFL